MTWLRRRVVYVTWIVCFLLPATCLAQLKIEVTPILNGDAEWDWTQVRTAYVPGESPVAWTTMSRTAKVGAHGYHDVYVSMSKDHGRSWSSPKVVSELKRAKQPDGYEVVAGDLWPAWHAPTRKILVTGKTFNFESGTKENFLREKVSYAVIDPETSRCSSLHTLKMPEADHEGKPFIAPNAGCHQRVTLSDGDILLPIR